MTQITQLSCLEEACKRLNLPSRAYDTHHNVLGIMVSGREQMFVKGAVPLGSVSDRMLFNDKEFTYDTCQEILPMPKTKGYFNPEPKKTSQKKYAGNLDINEIVSDIEKEFSYPVVVKMNSGTKSRFVFLCHNHDEIKDAVQSIFEKADNIVLAETCISIKKEYRAIILNGNLELLYEKTPKFFSKEDRKKVQNRLKESEYGLDQELQKKCMELLDPLCSVRNISYAGIDIVEDQGGKLWVLEVNTTPLFDAFITRYGRELLIQMYMKMLRSL